MESAEVDGGVEVEWLINNSFNNAQREPSGGLFEMRMPQR
jgi:hypothetical protein